MIYLMVTITKENIRMRGLNFEIEETGFNQCLDQNVIKGGLNNVWTPFKHWLNTVEWVKSKNSWHPRELNFGPPGFSANGREKAITSTPCNQCKWVEYYSLIHVWFDKNKSYFKSQQVVVLFPNCGLNFFSTLCNYSRYQKRVWQSTSNTSEPFCMQPP